MIVKTDTSGNILWQKLTNDSKIFNTICSISNNSYYALGISYGVNTGGYLLKFDDNGNSIFEKYLREDSIGYSNSIIRTNNNKYAFVYFKNGVNGMAIIDSTVNILQNKYHYYEPNDAVIYRYINNFSDGGYVLCGYIEQNNNNNIDILIVKTNANGETTPIGLVNSNQQTLLPSFYLSVYPNPFNPKTVIKFTIKNNDYLDFKLYDILGNEVIDILQKEFMAGSYTIPLNLNELNISSGIYFLVTKTYISKLKNTYRIIFLK